MFRIGQKYRCFVRIPHYSARRRNLVPYVASIELCSALIVDFHEPAPTAEGQFADVLNREVGIERMIAEAPHAPALHDDWPANEYYVLRQQLSPPWGRRLLSAH
jgi:hypothetical protein